MADSGVGRTGRNVSRRLASVLAGGAVYVPAVSDLALPLLKADFDARVELGFAALAGVAGFGALFSLALVLTAFAGSALAGATTPAAFFLGLTTTADERLEDLLLGTGR